MENEGSNKKDKTLRSPLTRMKDTACLARLAKKKARLSRAAEGKEPSVPIKRALRK